MILTYQQHAQLAIGGYMKDFYFSQMSVCLSTVRHPCSHMTSFVDDNQLLLCFQFAQYCKHGIVPVCTSVQTYRKLQTKRHIDYTITYAQLQALDLCPALG